MTLELAASLRSCGVLLASFPVSPGGRLCSRTKWSWSAAHFCPRSEAGLPAWSPQKAHTGDGPPEHRLYTHSQGFSSTIGKEGWKQCSHTLPCPGPATVASSSSGLPGEDQFCCHNLGPAGLESAFCEQKSRLQ